MPNDFRFYFGAASGSSRKALRQLEEPNVMLNYATKLNTPWEGIEHLFIDSGGYSFMKGMGEYETPDSEYLDFISEYSPEVFALRDYPCEPDVLDEHARTVADHQQRSLDRHRSLLNDYASRDIDATPLAVLQGWRIDDYLDCIDQYRDAGVLTEYVGIGSVCRRNQEAEIRRVILAVRDALPARIRLHAFGVKASVLKYSDVRDALASADSQSYAMQAQWESLETTGPGTISFRDFAFAYLKQRQRIMTLLAGEEGEDSRQESLLEAYDRSTGA